MRKSSDEKNTTQGTNLLFSQVFDAVDHFTPTATIYMSAKELPPRLVSQNEEDKNSQKVNEKKEEKIQNSFNVQISRKLKKERQLMGPPDSLTKSHY